MSTAGRLSGSSSRKGRSRGKRSTDHDSISYQDDRGHWGSRTEFLLSCLGYSVGLGNLWRFPYLAYENGGGAFIIPYLILLSLVGRPLYLLEVAIGQYSQLGPLHTWQRMAPITTGLGYTLLLRTCIGGAGYMLVICYSLYYLFDTIAYIGSQVPWSTCNINWADDHCYEVTSGVHPCSYFNLTESSDTIHCTTADQTSALQYWRYEVLRLSPEGLVAFGDLGNIHWGLLTCMLISWIIACLCVLHGIRSSGKVVYVTATLPFVIMLILIIAGLQLPGASQGVWYLINPQWDQLLNINVWRRALEQVIYSLSIGGGGLITFGSYNDFNNKVHIDVLILSVLDLIASLLCSITIFSVLGAMAHDLGHNDVGRVVTSGPGLAFVAYPEAISRTLSFPHLWSILFFLMILTLGLDSTFGNLETILTSLFDEYPSTRRHKPFIVVTVCALLFCTSIPFCTEKGQYVFYLLDVFMSGLGGLSMAFMSCIVVSWFYGVNRFSEDMEFMLNYKPSWFMKLIWAVITPVTLLVLFIGSLLRWEWPVYAKTVSYPPWAYTLGAAVPLLVLAPTVMYAISHVMEKIWTGKWRNMLRPSSSWGPGCPVARQRLREVRRLQRDGSNNNNNGTDNLAFDNTDI